MAPVTFHGVVWVLFLPRSHSANKKRGEIKSSYVADFLFQPLMCSFLISQSVVMEIIQLQSL